MAGTSTGPGDGVGSAAARAAMSRRACSTTHARGSAKSKLASAAGGAKGGSPAGVKLPKKLEPKNDSAARLAKKGASADKIAKAQAVDAKASKAKVVGTKAGASKSAKLGHVAKGIAEGAAGKNAAGKAAGGQLTGAIAGGAQAALQVVKPKQLVVIAVILVGLMIAPLVMDAMIGFAVVSTISGAASNSVTTAVAGTYGKSANETTSIANLSAQGADNTHTPSTLVSALAFYESGAGKSAAQSSGTCPAKSPRHALCPAMAAPASAPVSTTTTTGLTPAVGRNAHVPRLLSTTSPDFVTTNTADWACIRQAESGDNYHDRGGAYGFLTSTWSDLTGHYLHAGTAPPAQQNAVALNILGFERHFYSGWTDSCIPGYSGPEAPMTAVAPGVDTPATPGSATSYGATPLTVAQHPTTPKTTTTTTTTTPAPAPTKTGCKTGTGPYCLTGTLPAKTRTRPLIASAWVARQITSQLRRAGYRTSPINLTADVSATTPPSSQPYVDHLTPQAKIEATVEAALSKLPVTGQSTALDRNVELLATAWAAGYSPPVPSRASATTPCPTCNIGPVPTGAVGKVIAFALDVVHQGVGYVWGGGHGAQPGPSMGTDGKGVPACVGGLVVATAMGAGNPCTAQDETLTGQAGLDCSGFTRWVWSTVGITINGTATTQYQDVKLHSALVLTHSKLVAGDLIFYAFGGGGVDHVAIYGGHGMIIQEPETGFTAQVVTAQWTSFVGGGMP